MSFKEDFVICLVLLKHCSGSREEKGLERKRKYGGVNGKRMADGGQGLTGSMSSSASLKHAFLCCRGCGRPVSSSGSVADNIPSITEI